MTRTLRYAWFLIACLVTLILLILQCDPYDMTPRKILRQAASSDTYTHIGFDINGSSGAAIRSSSFAHQEIDGCPKCDSALAVSCGKCIFLGHRKGLRPQSRIYEVSYVVYDRGKPLFTGTNARQVEECGQVCYPAWSNFNRKSELFTWHDQLGERSAIERQNQREIVYCSDYIFHSQPALIHQLFSGSNIYHSYVDNIIPLFITLARISQSLGCSAERVLVYVRNWNMEKHPVIWNSLWRFFSQEHTSVSDMHGCYRRVYYGQMMYSVPEAVDLRLSHDTVMSSWVTALRSNIWKGLALSARKSTSSSFLSVHHPRAPTWMKSVNWSIPGVAIRPIDFSSLPWTEQYLAVAGASGLLGTSGAGIAQQLFLPLASPVLLMTHLEATAQCQWFPYLHMGDRTPCGDNVVGDHGFIYLRLALLGGNSCLLWQWCKPHVLESSAAITSKEAQGVLKLLISRHRKAKQADTVWIGILQDGESDSPMWPRCRNEITAPIARPRRYCTPYGLVGEPFLDRSSFQDADEKQTWRVIKFCGKFSNCSESERLVDIVR